MRLSNGEYAVSVSTAKVYKDCIQNHVSNTDVLYMWLPMIENIHVNYEEGHVSEMCTIIKFKDEDAELNLGFTGIEWVIDDYLKKFYKQEK